MLAGHQQKVMYIYRIFCSEAILAGYKKSCKFTGFPVQRLCWQAVSQKSCELTGVPVEGRCQRESCKLVTIPDQKTVLVAMLLIYISVFQTLK